MQATESTTASSITTQPTTPFRLMRLPGELRNMIYREYFNTVSEDPEDGQDTLDALRPCLNILHANRRLRSEAASIFYQEYVGNPGGLSSQPIEGSDYRWRITGNSKEAQLQRLALFCQSLEEHRATDVNLSLKFDYEGPQEVISPNFVEFLSNYMVGSLCGGRQDASVRVSSNWQRVGGEVAGRTRHGMASLSLIRTIGDGAIKMIYDYGRCTDRENFTLVGQLAKIDWSRLHVFEFPGPTEALELRGDVTVWFAEGDGSKYSSQRTVRDSLQEPDLISWWTNVGHLPRRVRIWNTEIHAWRSVYVDSNDKAVMDEEFISTGPRRRNSIHGYESRGSPASRS